MNILQVLSPNRKWALMLWQFIHQPFHFWTKQLELLIKNLYLMQFIGTAISMMQWCHPIFWTAQHNFEIIYFCVFPYLNLTIALADRIITWRNRFREGGQFAYAITAGVEAQLAVTGGVIWTGSFQLGVPFIWRYKYPEWDFQS